jgi:hypothetical protein
MKTASSVAGVVAGVLFGGGALMSATALGQTLNPNDFIVYIQDTSNSTFYAADTGVPLSSIVGANGSLKVALTAAQLNAGPNLAAFLAQGGNFVWAIAAAGTATDNPGDQIVVGLASGAPSFDKYGTVDTGIDNANNFAEVLQADLMDAGVQTSATDGWTKAVITDDEWQRAFGDSEAVISSAALNAPLTLYTLTSGEPDTATNTTEVITLTASGFTVAPIPPVMPTVAPAIAGTLGQNGWYVTPVTLSWTVTGFPAPTTSGCGTVVQTDSKGATYTCTATNSAGSASQTVTIKQDTVAPTVTIKAPKNGKSYALNAKLDASYTCADATSGVATCVGTVADKGVINTSVAGTFKFTVNATDKAGNASTSTVTYKVK